MHCPGCNYPLWNITARQCPECGAPFRPSDFDLLPNAVRFCCPHCDKAYYGTGPRGHLVPAAFTCVGCARAVAMDEMVLRPAEGVGERGARVETMPWLEREGQIVRPFFATIREAMVRPSGLIRAVPEDVSWGRAWGFMFLSNMLFSLAGQLVPALVVGGGVLLSMRSLTGVAIPGMLLGATAAQLGIQIVMLAVVPLLWVWLTHGLLAISGGAGTSLRRTGHAIFYASAARGLSAIPCVPDQVGQVWWLVSAILMVRQTHRCSGGRATFAVLVAGLVCAVTLVGGSLAVTYGMGGFAGGLTGQTVAVAEVQPATDALRAHAAAHGGVGPGHAAALLADGRLTVGAFTSAGTLTALHEARIGSVTLNEFAQMGPNRKTQIAAEAAAALPAGTVAHRVGDLVFTYHGIAPLERDPRLWIVILHPDPAANLPDRTASIVAGTAGGGVVPIAPSRLRAMLRTQNAVRAEHGLPPLPPPGDVRGDAPAADSG